VNSVLEKGSSCAGLAPGDTDRVGPHGPYGVGRLILIRLHKNAGYARGYLIDNDVGLLVREAAALAANDVVAGSHYHLPLRAKNGHALGGLRGAFAVPLYPLPAGYPGLAGGRAGLLVGVCFLLLSTAKPGVMVAKVSATTTVSTVTLPLAKAL
jgi:hypothetical protein